MKNCAPCPLYEHCVDDIEYRQARFEATQGNIRGAHRFTEEMESMDDEVAEQKIAELGGPVLARYLYDDGARDPDSISEALDTGERIEPGMKDRYLKLAAENENEVKQLSSLLETVQASCEGPIQQWVRRWFRRKSVAVCSADRAVFKLQNHPFIEQYGYSQLESRALAYEVTALGADIAAGLAAMPTMVFTAATISTAAIDFASDSKLNAASWLYQVELYPAAGGLALMLAFGGLGRVLHRVGRTYDPNLRHNSL